MGVVWVHGPCGTEGTEGRGRSGGPGLGGAVGAGVPASNGGGSRAGSGGAGAADTDAAVVAGRVLRAGVAVVHGHGWRAGDAPAGWGSVVGCSGARGGVAVGGGAEPGSGPAGPGSVAVVVRVGRGPVGVAGHSGWFLAGPAGAQRRWHHLGCPGHGGELGPFRWAGYPR